MLLIISHQKFPASSNTAESPGLHASGCNADGGLELVCRVSPLFCSQQEIHEIMEQYSTLLVGN
jgi:hypothetical protein